MTVEQLKALGFDLIGQIEQAQHNLRVVQQELTTRGKEEVTCEE